MTVNLDWQKDAGCRDTGHNAWYPADDVRVHSDFETLRRVCRECPVQSECLSHAIHHEEFGFWGGVSQHELRKLRKKNNIPLEVIW